MISLLFSLSAYKETKPPISLHLWLQSLEVTHNPTASQRSFLVPLFHRLACPSNSQLAVDPSHLPILINSSQLCGLRYIALRRFSGTFVALNSKLRPIDDALPFSSSPTSSLTLLFPQRLQSCPHRPVCLPKSP